MTWTIRYTSDAGTWTQGRYADETMAHMNARLAIAAGLTAKVIPW